MSVGRVMTRHSPVMALSITRGNRPRTSRVLAALALTGFVGCPSTGGGSGPLTVETPAPTPEPTPIAGTARVIAMSVSPGSTLVARPLGTNGQQVQELRAAVGVTLSRDVPAVGFFNFFLRKPPARCLGAGAPGVRNVTANVEFVIETLNMSNSGTGPPMVCPLPYTTTDAEILAFDPAGSQLFRAELPLTYHFVAP